MSEMISLQTSSDFLRFESHAPEDIMSFMESLIEFAKDETIWLLEGEMGAVKTTFIRQLGEYLSFVEPVQSPTFSIVNEYRDNNGNIYYHFDFYRINNEREAFEIGCEEYFYSGNICFIEWSSRIDSLIPDTFLKIQIETDNTDQRVYLITHEKKVLADTN